MAKPWLLRTVTFATWLLVALCATYWSLKFVPSSAAPAQTVAMRSPPVVTDIAAITRVLGPPLPVAAAASAPVAPPEPQDRLVLMGVVADRVSQGVALIAVNGKPARPYRVGVQIEDRYVLKSVAKHSAVLTRTDKGDAMVTLELSAPSSTPEAIAPAPRNSSPGGGDIGTPGPFVPGLPGAPPPLQRPG